MNIRILERKQVGELFGVKLCIELRDKEFYIDIDNLSRVVRDVRGYEKDNSIVIELIDENGNGFGCCIIDKSHFERGCMECKSLLLPKS